jgi:hypothetical protein
MSKCLSLDYGFAETGTQPIYIASYTPPNGHTGRAPTCKAAVNGNPLRIDEDDAAECGDTKSILQIVGSKLR